MAEATSPISQSRWRLREPRAWSSSPWFQESLWALAAMALSLAVAVVAWRLWDANLRVPIFAPRGDAAWTIVTVKGVIQHGWYESNPSLAAPFGQLNYDFPAYVGELYKVLMVKALALLSTNPAVVMNLVLLLGFPLTGLTGYLVLRRLRFTRAIALVCAVLFAASPIHFFLAPLQAWLATPIGIPLSAFLILAALDDATPMFTRRAGGGPRIFSWLSRRTALTLAICLLVGGLGLDYAEFTCLLVGIGALLVFFMRKRISLLVRAAVVIVAIAIPVVGSALPDLAYRARHGTNLTVAHRYPIETLSYGLEPIELLLPQRYDRVGPFAELTSRIDTDLDRGAPGVPLDLTSQVSLGLISAIGLLWLLWIAVSAALGSRVRDSLSRRAGTAALLTILVAMTGGASVLFAYLVTSQLRVWARIAILVAFFAVVGLGLLLERARRFNLERAYPRAFYGVALVVVLGLGLLEGTSDHFIPEYSQLNASWHEEVQFVAGIQHSLPNDAMVLELPYVPYPEQVLPTGLSSYEPLLPYLHSTDLRWSGGAMEGRPTDWLASASGLPTEQLIDGSVAAGFRGVYIERAGYADNGAATVAAVQSLAGPPTLGMANGSDVFFNLTGYARRLRSEVPPATLSAVADATVYPLAVEYGRGFFGPEPGTGSPRWAERRAVITISNPAHVPQTATYSATLVTGYPKRAPVDISWPDGISSEVLVSSSGQEVKRTLRVPPGKSTIVFTTLAPRVQSPSDPRVLYLHFANSTLTSTAYEDLTAARRSQRQRTNG